MSLDAKRTYVVPDQTAQVARAIFPKGKPIMRLYDDLHMVVEDQDFADLFPARGQPAEAPVRLALATLLQFLEGLTDRQAADAVRTRIDWKYVLCLELTDVGFDHTVLSEFRTRLLAHGAEGRLFDAVLELARERGLLKAGGRQRSDSTHVLGAMRTMSRLEVVTETLRHTLNVLATTAPDWLRARTTPAWVDRYGLRASEFRWPKSESGRRAWAVQTGIDGLALLAVARADDAPTAVRDLPALEVLRQVWVQNFLMEHGPDGSRVAWPTHDQTPPSGRYIGSPYDVEARYATKGATVWSGYKVHLTETCDDATPNLITNVETTTAAVSDDAVTATIHAALGTRGLLPAQHIADTGFVNAALFVEARERYGVDLIGPTRGDQQWQAKAGAGFAARDFAIDFAAQRATCPAGKVSQSWTPALARGTAPVIKIKFAVADCRACPLRAQCTRSTSKRRAITIRPEAQHEALRVRRAREKTADFAAEYARRAGVEGTIAQGVRSARLRRTPYFGHAKTHLAHLMTAAAMNLARLLRWLAHEPKARTRQSAFAQLHLLAA
ncbi:MAG TPA: IS1182 family transposase [Gemmatirosa sp.]